MGIILIIAGALILISGILIVSTNQNTVKDIESKPQSIMVEKRIHDTVKEPVVIESREPNPAESQPTESQPIETVADTMDKSKIKGDAFEDFVVNLLADWRLKLLDRTQDAVSSAGVVAQSCKNPDLHVQQKRGNGEIDYYLECKYRSHWKNGAVTFDDWQINRYRKFQRDTHRKVLIALGVGGTPSSPASLMLVPLDSIRDNTIRHISTEFAVAPSSSALVEYMNHYFTNVFSKARSR